MKISRYLLMILFVTGICSCLGAPKISFDAKSFDFGQCEQNLELYHTFKFKNVGGSPLIIKKVNPG